MSARYGEPVDIYIGNGQAINPERRKVDTCKHKWEGKLKSGKLERAKCLLCGWWGWSSNGGQVTLYRDRFPTKEER